jgi:hypothetical protein
MADRVTPGEELAAVLVPLMPAVNVYGAPPAMLKAPALVLRPDEPWIRPGRALGALTEQWLAVAVAPAGDPRSGMDTLRSILLGLIDALPAGWALRDTGRPIIDESTGAPVLAAAARLTFAIG